MSDEIVREFLVESAENLDLLDRELVRLEKDPHNRDTLASVFRTIHTIKGTCGFLGFTKLESIALVGENLLSKLLDGELALNPDITTALLQMVDAIRQVLASVEAMGNEGERNDHSLIEIFCCNVLIYFDLASKRKVVQHFFSSLQAPGYFFLGHAESLYQITDQFRLVHLPGATTYCKAVPGLPGAPKP